MWLLISLFLKISTFTCSTFIPKTGLGLPKKGFILYCEPERCCQEKRLQIAKIPTIAPMQNKNADCHDCRYSNKERLRCGFWSRAKCWRLYATLDSDNAIKTSSQFRPNFHLRYSIAETEKVFYFVYSTPEILLSLCLCQVVPRGVERNGVGRRKKNFVQSKASTGRRLNFHSAKSENHFQERNAIPQRSYL